MQLVLQSGVLLRKVTQPVWPTHVNRRPCIATIIIIVIIPVDVSWLKLISRRGQGSQGPLYASNERKK